MICKSWVLRIFVRPVPNSCTPASATATISNVVKESLSGTVILAWPLASSTTPGCHDSTLSNSSRRGLRPPPPPAATALRP
ncbi:hypothetical protein D3C80_1978450 [compost metagenome]